MSPPFIFAILFAIPTFGGSLVAYFVYAVYRLHRTSKKIEETIQSLSERFQAKEGAPPGVATPWISYSAVLGYAQSDRCQIIDQVGTYVEFKVVLNKIEYQVTLNKAHDVNTPIITSTTALQRLRHWLRGCMVPTKTARKSDAELLEEETLSLGDTLDPDLIWQENSAFLPEEICILQRLSYLSLQFKGIPSIPKTIGRLVALEVLKLGGNHLETLPAEIGRLHNLKILTAWRNRLISIPKEIGQLKNLEGLDLTENPLLTTLPNEVVMLTNLQRLYLDSEVELTPGQELWIRNLAKKGCDLGSLASRAADFH